MLDSGQQFFADIEVNQIPQAGIGFLRELAARSSHYSLLERRHNVTQMDVSQDTIELLIERELIENRHGQYSFQVELIRRWFANIQ
ncbi:MAG: hypothetical protein AAF702_22360 [Chloroflexota bacterium]